MVEEKLNERVRKQMIRDLAEHIADSASKDYLRNVMIGQISDELEDEEDNELLFLINYKLKRSKEHYEK
jgi:hypothetical protein